MKEALYAAATMIAGALRTGINSESDTLLFAIVVLGLVIIQLAWSNSNFYEIYDNEAKKNDK